MTRLDLNASAETQSLERIRSCNPEDFETINIRGGSISLKLAIALRVLMENPGRLIPLRVFLSDCYPSCDDASRELSKAFSTKIGLISVRVLDSLMLRAVFRLESPHNAKKHLKEIKFDLVSFDEDGISSLQSILLMAKSLDSFTISDCEFLDSRTNSRLFRRAFDVLGSSRMPKVNMSHMSIENFGGHFPFSPACEWKNLKRLALSSSLSCVPNLSDFPNLEYLYIFYSIEHLETSSIPQLLKRPDCRLEHLQLPTLASANFANRLFRAIKKNKSLRALETGRLELSCCSESFLDCIASNNTLRSVEFFSLERRPQVLIPILAKILKKDNSSLEAMNPARQYESVQHLLARNWAGRRILSSQLPVPVGLWPLILARIDKYDGEEDLRSDSAYHLVRNCDIAQLLNNALAESPGNRQSIRRYSKPIAPKKERGLAKYLSRWSRKKSSGYTAGNNSRYHHV